MISIESKKSMFIDPVQTNTCWTRYCKFPLSSNYNNLPIGLCEETKNLWIDETECTLASIVQFISCHSHISLHSIQAFCFIFLMNRKMDHQWHNWFHFVISYLLIYAFSYNTCFVNNSVGVCKEFRENKSDKICELVISLFLEDILCACVSNERCAFG